MSLSPRELQERLEALRGAYASQLPSKLDAIESLWNDLRQQWDQEQAAALHRAIHSLSGSGATFGFDKLSEQAREIEIALKAWLQHSQQPNPAQQKDLDKAFEALHQASSIKRQPAATTEAPLSLRSEEILQPCVYILEDDPDMAAELLLQLSHYGYESSCFSDAPALEAAIAEKMPHVLIADIIIDRDSDAGIQAVAAIRQRHGTELPVVFLSRRDDFEARLGAVRAGGQAYFIKPVDIGLLVDTLDQLTHHGDPDPYRILIVDDDQTLAAHYALTLEQAGMRAHVCNRPQDILEVLADSQPELILMDIYMPGCSGQELALIIRQQEAFLSLPILFLSTETNPKRQAQAMRTGGDDFLTKPIEDRQLISAIDVRVRRARTLNNLIDKDSLTGLLKHTKIKEQLANELSRARRNHTTLSFAMLDIDHFKQVNDRHGHLAGDRVIKSLARLLRQRLRNTDIVGRYGGEEFAIVLPQCDTDEAGRLLDEIREHFRALRFLHGIEEFSVSFSAGIAAYPPLAAPEDIIKAADAALYESKRRGRNRVTISNNG